MFSYHLLSLGTPLALPHPVLSCLQLFRSLAALATDNANVNLHQVGPWKERGLEGKRTWRVCEGRASVTWTWKGRGDRDTASPPGAHHSPNDSIRRICCDIVSCPFMLVRRIRACCHYSHQSVLGCLLVLPRPATRAGAPCFWHVAQNACPQFVAPLILPLCPPPLQVGPSGRQLLATSETLNAAYLIDPDTLDTLQQVGPNIMLRLGLSKCRVYASALSVCERVMFLFAKGAGARHIVHIPAASEAVCVPLGRSCRQTAYVCGSWHTCLCLEPSECE